MRTGHAVLTVVSTAGRNFVINWLKFLCELAGSITFDQNLLNSCFCVPRSDSLVFRQVPASSTAATLMQINIKRYFLLI